MKPYFVFEDIQKESNLYRENGNEKGISSGWKTLDEILTFKKGYPVYIAGAPHSGKTEWTLELMLSLSVNQGYKWFVYSGEIGSIAELVAELCFKYIGKPYIKRESNGTTYQMNEGERASAEYFISKHFCFIDPEDPKSSIKSFTVSEFYSLVEQAEKELGIIFDGTLIDPWNDVANEIKDYGGREDVWLADALLLCRTDAKKNKRINIIVNHIADIKAVFDKESGKRYLPVALPNEWAGGRTWWRRAYLMILIYRPPVFLNNEVGCPHEPNESQIIIQKAKPKGIAKIGSKSLYWDWKTNRYYEKDEYGELRSPFVKKKEPQQTVIKPTKKEGDEEYF